MKKKLIFFGIVLLALVLTTGTFAYTYNNQSGVTLNATLADAVWTTYQPSAVQPDWERIVPQEQYNYEYLIPIAPGDDTEFITQVPDSGEHWDKVSDIGAPDTDTYISTKGSNQWERDLYRLSPFYGMGGLEKIAKVTVYFRFAAGGNYNVTAMAALKTNDQVYEGPNETLRGTDFATYSWEIAKNPATDKAWTQAEINNLQAGVTAQGAGKNRPLLCTSVYVLVEYTYTIIQGAVPTGDLYDITPYPGYTGDLLVKLYLTNVADLLKAYQYINMKVYMANSLEAGNTPEYQIMSIETGVILFNIEGGSASKYTISIVGGAYRLISDKTEEWSPGWTVTPEFYCEVTQR
jgi:hypothetical protein